MQAKINELISKNVDLFCIICIFFVCLLLFFPYIFSNPAQLIFPVSDLGTDLDRDVLPNIEYIVNTIKNTGEIPLWRTYLLSGAPLVGHPSLPIFYPLYWVLLVIPIPIGLNVIALLNLLWMGIGTYFYLKYIGENKSISALAGAIVMAISPKWIAHLSGGHWIMLTALGWAPWTFISLDQYWKKRSFYWLFLLAIALASIGVNFFPYFVIVSLALAFLSITYLSNKSLKSHVKTMIFGWSVVIILVIGLTSAQVLPLIELLPFTVHTTNNSTFTSLHPLALLSTIFPPELKYPEWFLYAGISILIFSSISYIYGWSKLEKTWVVLGLSGLILSLGDFTPIYSWLFGWNPLISILRVPTRWWFLTIFALIILFTKGFNYWIENKQHINTITKLIITFILFLQIIAGGIKLFQGDLFPFSTIFTAIISIILGIILFLGNLRFKPFFAGLIILISITDLMIVNYSLIQPKSAEITGVSKEFSDQITSKLNQDERVFSPGGGIPALFLVRSDIHAAEGYDALPLENYLKFIRIATGCPLVQEATGSQEELEACLNPDQARLNWLKLLNVRFLVVQNGNEWDFKELSPGFGRAFSVHETLKTSDENCLEDLKTINVSYTALVDGETINQQNGNFKIIEQKRYVNKETFHVLMEKAPTLLIRSESWSPGWKARVDGQLSEVNRVNCVLQGVWVEDGEHVIEFSYKPFGYPIGFWISVGTISFLITFILVSTLKKYMKRKK